MSVLFPVKPLTRAQMLRDEKAERKKCVVCKKKWGVECRGGHLCSYECEQKYVACEEKYF